MDVRSTKLTRLTILTLCPLALAFANAGAAASQNAEYTYDAQGRVISVEYSGSGEFTYVYDRAGNRLSRIQTDTAAIAVAPDVEAEVAPQIGGADAAAVDGSSPDRSQTSDLSEEGVFGPPRPLNDNGRPHSALHR